VRNCARVRGIQYAAASRSKRWHLGVLDRPVKPGDDTFRVVSSYAATTAGIGSAVTDLIFSIAKREVTFFSGTALISFL